MGINAPSGKTMTIRGKAEKLYQKLLEPKSSLDYSDPTLLIAEYLQAAREEGQEESYYKGVEVGWDLGLDFGVREGIKKSLKSLKRQGA